MPIPIPPVKVQKAIAKTLTTLDTKVTLEKNEVEKFQNLKSAMLTKMFPKKGGNVPEIRFDGFTDVWEQRKLGEVTELKSASRVHKGEWTDSGVPFFRSSDVMAAINGATNEKAYISEELYEKLSSASGKLEKGDVLVTGGGSVGNPYIVPNNEPLYTIVFIIDEAHRSQFGVMHERVKRTFYNSLFFGFTGTPIFAENMKPGELTTETVFGECLAVYSLATGIRDGNVLGFWPEAVKTYADKDLKEAVALAECHATSKEDIVVGSDNWKLYRHLTEQTPMASELDDHGQIKRDKNGNYIKGIEDYLPGKQYDNDDHRKRVVESILANYKTIAYGEYGTLFHGILATESIPEAYEYWKLFKAMAPNLHVTSLFDPNINANSASVFNKENALADIVSDYNNCGLIDWRPQQTKRN